MKISEKLKGFSQNHMFTSACISSIVLFSSLATLILAIINDIMWLHIASFILFLLILVLVLTVFSLIKIWRIFIVSILVTVTVIIHIVCIDDITDYSTKESTSDTSSSSVYSPPKSVSSEEIDICPVCNKHIRMPINVTIDGAGNKVQIIGLCQGHEDGEYITPDGSIVIVQNQGGVVNYIYGDRNQNNANVGYDNDAGQNNGDDNDNNIDAPNCSPW